MLNTRKLLYILPDVAYIAELLPAKKDHTFAIQSFRQINGEFLNEDDDLIAANIDKLLGKLEPDTYHLILPDFLFTNTIIEIKETQESKVKEYVKEKLLPSLGLTKNTHDIATFVLTQYGGVSKLQLTALEKSVLDPVVIAATDHRVQIDKISPLSWTIKSIVSLEPSISIIQIGGLVYLAEHYIGVDQCTMASTDEIENVVDTIKTLKGAQPSIQTIYLLTNTLVEEKLKEHVSKTIPIQQLASFKEEDSQMPSYVKHIIEAGMRTLDIPDFPVPTFLLPKTASKPLGSVPAASSETSAESEVELDLETQKPRPLNVFDDENDIDDEVETSDTADSEASELNSEIELTLPQPSAPVITEALELPAVVAELPAVLTTPPVVTSVAAAVNVEPTITQPVTEKSPEADEVEEPVETDELEPARPASIEETPPAVPASTAEAEESNLTEPDLSVFAPKSPSAITEPSGAASINKTKSLAPRTVIKNKGGTNMVKGIAVLLATLAITTTISAGIGTAVLRLTDESDKQVATTASPSPDPSTATASPSPTAQPSPTPTAVARKELSILVVNATTTPGYAGTTKAKLEKAGFKLVTAANAKGEYEAGTYVLMPTEDKNVTSTLQTDSGLTLELATGFATEDPKAAYDAVIVLAQ